MSKVEILPTQDLEAGYGPVQYNCLKDDSEIPYSHPHIFTLYSWILHLVDK